jgi:oligosaccharyltransferase complex subunit alpha (ribophorin I)
MIKKTCNLLFLVLAIGSIFVSAIDNEVENKSVERTIDITSQLVKTSYKITLDHKAKKPINNYVFLLPIDECNKLSYFSARDANKKELKFTQSKNAEECSYTMTLTAGNNNPVIFIEAVLTKSLLPFPTQITQAERQLVRYFGNAYLYSPYKTVSQKTTIHLPSRSVESFTQHKPSNQADTQIVYGPYDNIACK